jgi:hypothetical protein
MRTKLLVPVVVVISALHFYIALSAWSYHPGNMAPGGQGWPVLIWEVLSQPVMGLVGEPMATRHFWWYMAINSVIWGLAIGVGIIGAAKLLRRTRQG